MNEENAQDQELEVIEGEIETRKESGPKQHQGTHHFRAYFGIPALLLLVCFLGGLRIGSGGGFLFVPPPLVSLIFAIFLVILFFRNGLISSQGWFPKGASTLSNATAASMITILFFASAQIFNSLIPERGITFWMISFFFFWSLWTNLFAEVRAKKLIVSIGSLFIVAFLFKYVLLGSIGASADEGFFAALLEGNLGQRSIAYLLDVPAYARSTGYIQFFTLLFYVGGLWILEPLPRDKTS